MPVVEKIESVLLTNVVILNKTCNIRHFKTTDLEHFKTIKLDLLYAKTSEDASKKQAVWLAVVEFIKWYNQQQ